MILDKRYSEKRRFAIVRRTPKHEQVDIIGQEPIQFERMLAGTLFVLMVLALVFQRYTNEPVYEDVVNESYFDVSDIPRTTQSGGRRQPTPPEMPAIPIEAESESILETETIAFTGFSFNDLPPMPGPPTGGSGGGVSTGPRLVKEVFPNISDRIKGKGVKGEIELRVKVNANGKVEDIELLRNTTQSSEIAQAAIEAARQCVYMPGMRGNKPVSVWTTRKLRIDYTE